MILNRKGIPWYNGIDSFDAVSLQVAIDHERKVFFGYRIISMSIHVSRFSSPYLPCRARTARTAHSPFFNHTEGFIYQDGRHLKTDCK